MRYLLLSIIIVMLFSCEQKQQYDYVITGGLVFVGDGSEAQKLDIAIRDGKIHTLAATGTLHTTAKQVVNAEGMIVTPGFIDPHTHSLVDLRYSDSSGNRNYLTQGVTTVLTGNDGGGPINIKYTMAELMAVRPGTNFGLFAGHNTIRQRVMGMENRMPTPEELTTMKTLLLGAMEEGAFGFSTGLYYAPGSFAETVEIIELTAVLKETGGVYESHIRDESSYSVGLIGAIKEVIEIGQATGVPVHIAHIKALGVDVWGKSAEVVDLINQARAEGIHITADQYPWRASGTRISNALIPNWVKADSTEKMIERLRDEELSDRIHTEVVENLRIRGGGEALLIVSGDDAGKTLKDVAEELAKSEVKVAIDIVIAGDARVASFNMSPDDIEHYMRQPWVMTSSDGTKGHPRKYASYPQKYISYVKENQVLTLAEFIHRSTGLVAETFNICGRGMLREGYAADILIFDPTDFSPQADFSNPEVFTQGVQDLFVNGNHVIKSGKLTDVKAGHALSRDVCTTNQ